MFCENMCSLMPFLCVWIKVVFTESKVLQYFGNMVHYSTLDAFAEVIKKTNHTERPSSPDTLSIPRSMTSQSTVLGLPNFTWLSTFLQPEQTFMNPLVTILSSTVPSLFIQQIFLLLLWHYGPLQIHKT